MRALSERAGAEALGAAFLLAGIVGSGIMGERLAGGNVAIALLANSLATARRSSRYSSRSRHAREGGSQLVSELVATFGLISTITGTARSEPRAVPLAVGANITAAYWFTGSTSFANPSVTIARSLSDTFAGIRPIDVPGFVAAQFAGAAAALVWRRLSPPVWSAS